MKKTAFLIISISLFLTGSHIFAKRLPETVIKIGLLENKKSFNISSEGKYYIYELNSGRKTDIKPLNDYLVRGDGTNIQFNGGNYSSTIRVVPRNSKNRVRVDGRRYRDSMLIKCKNGKLTVINELGLEGYVFGILPREVSASWPEEVLKAQAIVSRTYALRNLGKHKKQGFDLCAKTHCQVYGGVESEDERTTKAVKSTRGRVLVFKQSLAQALFHACCAGHTENPVYVWSMTGSAPKYLKGRSCRFCKKSPHSSWKKKVKAEFIKARLNKAGYKVGNIKKIQKSGKTSSGRVNKLKVKHSKGALNISAAKFRLAVSALYVKSTYIDSITRKGAYFIFEGRGWGHGVGMCQWGAKGIADKGHDYKQIIKFYFPGTKVEKWEE